MICIMIPDSVSKGVEQLVNSVIGPPGMVVRANKQGSVRPSDAPNSYSRIGLGCSIIPDDATTGIESDYKSCKD